jgi:hypothetical protein
MAAAMAKGGGT